MKLTEMLVVSRTFRGYAGLGSLLKGVTVGQSLFAIGKSLSFKTL